jgi:lipoprotein-releasing system permease protein
LGSGNSKRGDKMRPSLFLAIKDISQRKKEILMVILAISISVTGILLACSFNNAMYDGFVGTVIDTEFGHLKILSEVGEDVITNSESTLDKIEDIPSVIGVAPRIETGGLICSESKSSRNRIFGIWPSKERKATTLEDEISFGEFLDDKDMFKLLIGSGFAEDLKVDVGDHLLLSFITAENYNPKRYDFEIKGILNTGSFYYDVYSVFLPYKVVQDITGIEDATEIVIRLDDRTKTDSIKPIVEKESLCTNIKTWKDLSGGMASMISVFSIVASMTSGISIMVSAIAISIILYTSIKNKIRSIGVIKAIGGKNSFVFSVYLIEAMLIGIVGISIGTSCGLCAIYYLQANQIAVTPAAGMQVIISPWVSTHTVIVTDLAIFITCIFGCVYPALKAARVNIIEAIWHG